MKVIKTKVNFTTYSLVDISSIEINTVITFDIFIKREKNYIIIIEAGTLIFDNLYNKLKKQDSLYISKKDEDKQILSCETLKYYIKYNRDNTEKRTQLLYEVNNQLFDIFLSNKDNKIDLKCVELIIQSIIYLIKYDKDFIKNTIPYLISEYKLANHSLHVTIYAITLGNVLNLTKEQLLQLGISAILHDTGIKKLDKTILHKDTIFDESDTLHVNRHTQYSVDIVKQNHIHDPYIIDAIMHHHERCDGTGYPEGLNGNEISEFASILSVCDVFDALTNTRPHRKRYSYFDALKLMMQDTLMKNQLNQKYLHLGIKLL